MTFNWAWIGHRRRWPALLAVMAASLAGCGGSATSSTSASPAVSGVPSRDVSLATLEEGFVAVVREVQPEVAEVQVGSRLGSGVIFDGSGDIVTNAHITRGVHAVLVRLADGRRFQARLVGEYWPDDLAVVTVGPGHGLKWARFGNSSRLAVGELVLAVGSPFGLQGSVTDGVISALGRSVTEPGGVVLLNAIQTSAPINPGNSGGALVDLLGQVVGIPTLAAANPQLGTQAAGIGFAIPSDTVADIAGQIVRYGRVVNSHRAARPAARGN